MQVLTITRREYDNASESEQKQIESEMKSGQIKMEGVEILPADALGWDRTYQEKRNFLEKLCTGRIFILHDDEEE